MDRSYVEPDGLDLLAAVRRRIWAFVIPVVLITAACVAYGLLRTPVYTAESRLSVGRLDVATQGIAGFAQAEVSIASALSRAVVAPDVIRASAKSAGISVQTAGDAIQASPVAGAPIILVEAKLDDAGRAVKLVNATASGLVNYVHHLGAAGGTTNQLSTQYAVIAEDVSRLVLARDKLRRIYQQHPSYQNRINLQGAEAKLARRILERNAAGNVYGAQATGLTAANLLGVLAPAYRASSDRKKTLEELAASGLIAGIVFGLALVGWLEAGRRRRRDDAVATAG
jgi:hypothetical protein